MAKNERTLKMIEEYVDLFDSGLTPREIAKRFDLSFTTIYQNLPEIAEKSGRSKESLLERPHKPHEMVNNRKATEKVNRVDIEKLRSDCRDVLSQMEIICEESSRFIREGIENEDNC